MLSTQKYDDPTYLRESWILYGIGVFVLLLRLVVRARIVGVQHYQGDDYLSLVVLACYTADAVVVKTIQHHGSNVDWTEAEMRAMTDQELGWIAYGSKLQLLCWYTYPTLMWSLKGCMLFFFDRLTLGLDSQRIVKWMAYACGLTYFVIIMVTSLSCLPYSENWATIPYPRAMCSTRFQDMYMVTILNVLTDAAMLCIPLPILWRLQVPLRRKLALGVLLLGGVFVIVAAIVRICMSLEATPSTMNINRWGIRETIAGIIAVNAPIIRPILSKRFWLYGAASTSGPSLSEPSSRTDPRKSRLVTLFRSRRKSKDAFEMLDPHAPPPFHPDAKAGGTSTTIRAFAGEPPDADSERDASDTASEDLIIQKPYRAKSPPATRAAFRPRRSEEWVVDAEEETGDERDLERGERGSRRRPSEQHGGINVTTTYTVRPASPIAEAHVVPEFLRREAGSPPPPAGEAVELEGTARDVRRSR